MRFYLGHRLPGGFWAGVSTYARRPHHAARQAARATGGIGCVGFVVLLVVLALSIAYWYISVPVLVLTAIAVGVTVHRQHVHRAPGSVVAPPGNGSGRDHEAGHRRTSSAGARAVATPRAAYRRARRL